MLEWLKSSYWAEKKQRDERAAHLKSEIQKFERSKQLQVKRLDETDASRIEMRKIIDDNIKYWDEKIVKSRAELKELYPNGSIKPYIKVAVLLFILSQVWISCSR